MAKYVTYTKYLYYWKHLKCVTITFMIFMVTRADLSLNSDNQKTATIIKILKMVKII